MKQRITRAAQTPRAALHVNTPVAARRARSKLRQVVQLEVHVVRHHQIDKSIAVVVRKGRSGGPPAVGNSCLCRHIRKGAIAIVAVKHVAAQTRHVDVRPAIVVVVAHRAAHGEARRRHPGLDRYIGKGSIVIVVEERTGSLFARDRLLHRRRVGEVKIRPAVTVAVHHHDAATHRLHDVLFFRRRLVHEVKARLLRHVLKLRNRSPMTHPLLGARRHRRRCAVGLPQHLRRREYQHPPRPAPTHARPIPCRFPFP